MAREVWVDPYDAESLSDSGFYAEGFFADLLRSQDVSGLEVGQRVWWHDGGAMRAGTIHQINPTEPFPLKIRFKGSKGRSVGINVMPTEVFLAPTLDTPEQVETFLAD